MDIAEFLLARIAEDETKSTDLRELADRIGNLYGSPEPPEEDLLPADRAYFAMHNAADRVLADCAAKRRIVERHKPRRSWSGGALQCDHCAGLCHSRSGLGCDEPDAPYPCEELRDLASVYADRPDFPEELRS